MSEHSQALHIANRWLDFKMNALTQMVPGDPDCDACVLARQFIRTDELNAVLLDALQTVYSHFREPHCMEALAPVIRAIISKATKDKKRGGK